MREVVWWKRFLSKRNRRNYSHKMIGAARPESHFRRPSRVQIMAAAKRFALDGEIGNAVEMVKLAYYPEQLNLRLKEQSCDQKA